MLADAPLCLLAEKYIYINYDSSVPWMINFPSGSHHWNTRAAGDLSCERDKVYWFLNIFSSNGNVSLSRGRTEDKAPPWCMFYGMKVSWLTRVQNFTFLWRMLFLCFSLWDIPGCEDRDSSFYIDYGHGNGFPLHTCLLFFIQVHRWVFRIVNGVVILKGILTLNSSEQCIDNQDILTRS